MYVCRRVTDQHVETGELPILRGEMVLHAYTMEELNKRVATYLGLWKWKTDHSIFGGYWVDWTLTGDRQGECYIIAEANADEIRMIEAAFQWHSGGGSPLYQFASTGCIFGEEHRARLITEIAACVPILASEQDTLSMLETHVRDRVMTSTLVMTTDS